VLSQTAAEKAAAITHRGTGREIFDAVHLNSKKDHLPKSLGYEF
jgi:predicted nucleotidyltransferase component of viral defense system